MTNDNGQPRYRGEMHTYRTQCCKQTLHWIKRKPNFCPECGTAIADKIDRLETMKIIWILTGGSPASSDQRVVIKGAVDETRETDKSWLFSDGTVTAKGDEKWSWMPKSRCVWDDDKNEMTMPLWIARNEKLI